MPAPPNYDPLADVWRAAGQVSYLPNGAPVALTWLELQAFAAMAGHDFSPYLWRTVQAMSAAYVNALRDTHPLSIMPSERAYD